MQAIFTGASEQDTEIHPKVYAKKRKYNEFSYQFLQAFTACVSAFLRCDSGAYDCKKSRNFYRMIILNTRSVFTLSGYLILSCPLLIFHRRPWRSIFLFKDERAICKVIISIIPEYICTACSESVHRV